MSDPAVAQHLDAFERERQGHIANVRAAFASIGADVFKPAAYVSLARWGWFIDDEHRHQSVESRKITLAVEKAAGDLLEALHAAREHAGVDDAEHIIDSSEDTNVCENILSDKDDWDEYYWSILRLSYCADQALKQGRIKSRGRPTLLSYQAFIKNLYDFYAAAAAECELPRKGYYEKNGEFSGPFVDLVERAQAILPLHMRLRERSTIGNRIVAALSGDIPPTG